MKLDYGGRLAQRLEHCIHIAGVAGSNPASSTCVKKFIGRITLNQKCVNIVFLKAEY